ncbi:hypothetical protein Tco_1251514 [Tanacetum coccineum]
MMWSSCVLTLPGFVRLTKQFLFGPGLALSGSTISVIRLLGGRMTILGEMSIYDFMTRPTWENAKVLEEPHEFGNSILQHRRKKRLRKKASEARTSAPAAERVEDVEGIDLSDYCTILENSLERDEDTFSRAIFAPSPRLGKRLGSPLPILSHAASSDPSHVGTSNAARAPSSGHGIVQKGAVATGSSRKAKAEKLDKKEGPSKKPFDQDIHKYRGPFTKPKRPT